jgi:hypothetical protein
VPSADHRDQLAREVAAGINADALAGAPASARRKAVLCETPCQVPIIEINSLVK